MKLSELARGLLIQSPFHDWQGHPGTGCWGGEEDGRAERVYLIAWEAIYQPLCDGGLGVHSMLMEGGLDGEAYCELPSIAGELVVFGGAGHVLPMHVPICCTYWLE